MIDLLVGVAKANSKVMFEPGPQAFFENFGDSSLDFKLLAWIDVSRWDPAGTRPAILSELAVAVQQTLDEAGIGVPFPQRDLHLISMPPNMAAELGNGNQP